MTSRTLLFLTTLASSLPADAQAPRGFETGRLVEDVACKADPTQTYTLYLPSAYAPDRSWPVLLIFDPRGRGSLAAEIFRDPAERYGWILLSSNNTRSDGPWEPNARAVTAMWPELGERFAVDPHRIYAAGFSGGAMVAYVLGGTTGRLAGVIGCGGRLSEGVSVEKFSFAHYGAAGNTDFNYQEMRKLDALLASQSFPHRLEIFEGPHRWLPPELAREAVEWMELQSMRGGHRERDPRLVDELLRKDLAKAEQLEASGRELDALRRYEAIGATFGGLVDVDEIRRRALRLRDSRSVVRARSDEQRWDAYEERFDARMLAVLNRPGDPEEPRPLGKLLAELGVPELRKQALEDSYAGVTARRLLDHLFTSTSFYRTRDALEKKDYARAALALSIAAEIRADDPVVWYNLACALAQGGKRKQALEALGRSIDHGFTDRRQLETDPDLESLRGDQGYERLLKRLGA